MHSKFLLYVKKANLFVFFLLLLSNVSFSIDEFQFDLDFLRELSRIEFNDYAELQLEQMQKKYPAQKDYINLEKARVYYSIGRSREADAAIAAIPTNSPLLNDVLLLKAQVFAARRNWVEADKVFKQFFAANQKPVSRKRSDQNSFKQAIMIYNMVLKSMNKPAEAAKILDLLSTVSGAVDERQMEFLKVQTALDALENKVNSGAAIDDKALAAAIKGMEDLQFIRDGVAASASVQLARAHIIRGKSKLNPLLKNEAANKAKIARINDFADAVRTIDMIFARLEELAKSLGLENDNKSPVVEAYFYRALAFAKHAAVTYAKDEKEKARNQIRGAATLFERILQDYPDSAFQNKALTEHVACSDFSEKKFSEKLELRQSGSSAIISTNLEKADAFFQKKDYKSAYPFCLEALRAGRIHNRLPEIGLRLIMCLVEIDDLNAADALLDYLSTMYPQAAGTADAALRLGAMLINKANAEKNAKLAQEYKDRAMLAFDKFVNAAPSHPRAADIAFTVAESTYQTASELAIASNQAKTDEEKLALQEKAKAAFATAIPQYQRMVELFGIFDKGIRSHYKLAWCYDSIEEKEKAAEHFLVYYDTETDEKYKLDRLQAKFRAAYLLLYGEQPNEAIGQFEDLLEVLGAKDSIFDLQEKSVVQINENSASLIAWAYHLTAEKLRPALTLFQRRQGVFQQRLQAYEKQLKESEEERQQAEKEQAALEQELSELQKVLQDLNYDFTAMAEKQISAQAEDTAQMTAAEKQIHMQTMAANIKERAVQLEQQKKFEIIGSLEMQEGRKANAVEHKERLTEQKEKQTADKNELQNNIKKLTDKITQAEAKVIAIRKEIKDSDMELTKADADRQTLQNKKSEIEGKVDDSSGNEKAKYQAELDKIIEQEKAINDIFQQAFLRNQAAISEKTQNELKDLEQSIIEDKEELTSLNNDMLRSEHDIAITDIELKTSDADEQAATRYIALLKVYEEKLNADEDQRKAAETDLERARKNAYRAAEEVFKSKCNKFALRKEFLLERDKYCNTAIKETKAQEDELLKGIAPVKEQFTAWKNDSAKLFLDFFQKHPDAKAVPDNMSMLGSIYLFDLDEANKASEILRRLADEYPKEPATQKALFMLGRAQAENGNIAEAAKSFEKLLAKPEEIALANLRYISDICLQAGLPESAIKANQEVLQRAANKNSPDYEQISRAAKERATFSLGQAQTALKRYRDAIKTLEQLLQDNEKTAYFLDVKFLLAEARAAMNPPDWDALEKDLYDILMQASSPAVRNRASCEYAEALLRSGGAEKRSSALSNFQLVLLADPSEEENLPLLERALYGSAKILSEQGKKESAAEMLKRYRELFSTGKHLNEMIKFAAE